MDDLKEIYTTNKDIIFVVEAGYLGSYGEWHDGRYDKDLEKKNKIIEKLYRMCDPWMKINPSRMTI